MIYLVIFSNRFFYFTNLRSPYERYLSEWLHVARGATWRRYQSTCKQVLQSVRNRSLCHVGATLWMGVTLDKFMDCPYNPATNRQTWMLADLESIGCERLVKASKETINQELLMSAKQNLNKMAYFGLTELRDEVPTGFREVFGLEYSPVITLERVMAVVSEQNISTEQENKIRSLNGLDIQLYDYAKKLFYEKFHKKIP